MDSASSSCYGGNKSSSTAYQDSGYCKIPPLKGCLRSQISRYFGKSHISALSRIKAIIRFHFSIGLVFLCSGSRSLRFLATSYSATRSNTWKGKRRSLASPETEPASPFYMPNTIHDLPHTQIRQPPLPVPLMVTPSPPFPPPHRIPHQEHFPHKHLPPNSRQQLPPPPIHQILIGLQHSHHIAPTNLHTSMPLQMK